MHNPFEKNKLLVAVVTATIFGITGCGGGGGGGGGDSASGGGSNTPAPAPEPEETIAEYFKAINFDPETTQYTGKGVNLAIYDTGILINHSEFAGRVSQFSGAFASEFSMVAPETEFSWKLKEVVGDDHDVDDHADVDTLSHGSIVTAIAAGENVGVAPGATLHTYDVAYSSENDGLGVITSIDPAGGGPDSYAAYLHIAEKGKTELSGDPNLDLDFANMSFKGARTYTVTATDATEILTKIAAQTETGIIISGGNDGYDLSEQAATIGTYIFKPVVYNATFADTIIVVGATDQSGQQMRSDSNTPGADPRWQDRFLVAPGTAIEGADYADANKTRAGSGTSMAAPLVTGAAALVKEKFPQLSNRQVLQVLLDTANKSIPDYDVTIHGQGLLDVEAALNVDPSLYATP